MHVDCFSYKLHLLKIFLRGFDMVTCNPCSTLTDIKLRLFLQAKHATYHTLNLSYCSLARAMQYLTFSYLDIAFVVQQVYLFMRDQRESLLHSLKGEFDYFLGTLHHVP